MISREGVPVRAMRVTEITEEREVLVSEGPQTERTCINGVAGFNSHLYGLPLLRCEGITPDPASTFLFASHKGA